MPGLLLLLLAIVPVSWQYPCGDVQIADDSECHCGETTLTLYDDEYCCGRAQCSIKDTGGGQCSAGTACSIANYDYPWLCGDIIIPSDSECLCGGDRITRSKNRDDEQWCCLPDTEQCSADGVCANGTVVTGYNKSCNGNCGKREYFPCKSGGECVPKADMCHGYPVCADASDIDYCQQDTDICDHDYRYSKCPGTPYGHQECYYKGLANDQVYHCLTRQDEEIIGKDKSEDTIDYESITPCNTTSRYSGLMCGDTCVWTSEWCNPSVPATSCQAQSTFSSQDPVLCQNNTFWSNKSCDWVDWDSIKYYGERCRGRAMHCYYPRHRRWDYSTDRLTCSDMSDQIYPVVCTNTSEAAQYCNTFCPQGVDTPVYGTSTFTDTAGNSVYTGYKCKSVCTPAHSH